MKKSILTILMLILSTAICFAGPKVEYGYGEYNPSNVTITGGTISNAAIRSDPVTHTGSATISATQMYGHTHVFTATATASLPAAVAGMHTALVMTAAAVMTIDPNGTEVIIHDRASLGAGVTIVSDGVAYAVIYLECVVTGYWIAYVNMGTFAAGS